MVNKFRWDSERSGDFEYRRTLQQSIAAELEKQTLSWSRMLTSLHLVTADDESWQVLVKLGGFPEGVELQFWTSDETQKYGKPLHVWQPAVRAGLQPDQIITDYSVWAQSLQDLPTDDTNMNTNAGWLVSLVDANGEVITDGENRVEGRLDHMGRLKVPFGFWNHDAPEHEGQFGIRFHELGESDWPQTIAEFFQQPDYQSRVQAVLDRVGLPEVLEVSDRRMGILEKLIAQANDHVFDYEDYVSGREWRNSLSLYALDDNFSHQLQVGVRSAGNNFRFSVRLFIQESAVTNTFFPAEQPTGPPRTSILPEVSQFPKANSGWKFKLVTPQGQTIAESNLGQYGDVDVLVSEEHLRFLNFNGEFKVQFDMARYQPTDTELQQSYLDAGNALDDRLEFEA